MELPYHLNRSVLIRAQQQTVFRFFTDNARWASWWGAGSTIDATPGGKVYIRHPNGIESLGEVVAVRSPEEIVFTYGFASGTPITPGGSRVTIRLEPDEAGTRLHLLHEFAEAGPRDEHMQGWRFQLSLFGNVAANEEYADAQKTVDAWFAAWVVADDQAREDILTQIATPGIGFRDRFSLLDSLADLKPHIKAAQRFMPGIGLQRKGPVRHCQGMVLADWGAIDGEGKERMSGTSVFVLAPDGRIDSATSFANPPPNS